MYQQYMFQDDRYGSVYILSDLKIMVVGGQGARSGEGSDDAWLE